MEFFPTIEKIGKTKPLKLLDDALWFYNFFSIITKK